MNSIAIVIARRDKLLIKFMVVTSAESFFINTNVCMMMLQEVFQCFLRNLFEEYRFFSEYPDKELHTTALLFGSIIEHGLVT